MGARDQDYDENNLNSVSNAGAAYIFKLSGGTWTQMAKLVAGDRRADDWFGTSVAISGDTAIVGAYFQDYDENNENNLRDASAAYIFKLSGGTWTQVAKLVAGDRRADDYFGYSVAISGDTAIVGAFLQDYDENNLNAVTDAGAAYIYSTQTLGPPGLTSTTDVDTLAFHHGNFDATDYGGINATVAEAAAAGFFYADTPTGDYPGGRLDSRTLNGTTSTTYTWTPATELTADVLMVAGGGGGGCHSAGGGGAGGLLFHESVSLSGQKTIVVGNGGIGKSSASIGNNGQITTFTGLENAIGGGGGGASPTGQVNGNNGGSGGGGGN